MVRQRHETGYCTACANGIRSFGTRQVVTSYRQFIMSLIKTSMLTMADNSTTASALTVTFDPPLADTIRDTAEWADQPPHVWVSTVVGGQIERLRREGLLRTGLATSEHQFFTRAKHSRHQDGHLPFCVARLKSPVTEIRNPAFWKGYAPDVWGAAKLAHESVVDGKSDGCEFGPWRPSLLDPCRARDVVYVVIDERGWLTGVRLLDFGQVRRSDADLQIGNMGGRPLRRPRPEFPHSAH